MSTLTTTTYTMPAASLGRENPLPDLKSVADAHAKIEIDETTVNREEARRSEERRVGKECAA